MTGYNTAVWGYGSEINRVVLLDLRGGSISSYENVFMQLRREDFL